MSIECPICYVPYGKDIRPYVSTCGHSICSKCFASLKSTSCPTCRVQGAFSTASENYLAKELLQHISRLNAQSTSDPSFQSTAIEEELAAVKEENMNLLSIIEVLSGQPDQIELLQNSIHSLNRRLKDYETRNQQLQREAEATKNELENRQRALDEFRRRTKTQFNRWNHEFRNLNGLLNRTTEEQEESSNPSTDAYTTDNSDSHGSDSESTTDDENGQSPQNECSVM